jgi:hypothetical protein
MSVVTMCAVVAAVLVYAHIVAYVVGPGALRLALLTPVLIINAIAPLHIIDQKSEVLAAAVAIANFGWWTNFKIIALAGGRGQLCGSLTTPKFLALAALPVKFAEDDLSNAPAGFGNNQNRQSFFGMLCKLLLLAGCMTVIPDLPNESQALKNVLYSFALYATLGALFDAGALIGVVFFSTPTAPHFDLPFLAHSFSNFWAMRWNLVAGGSLRDIVYAPIIEGSWVALEANNRNTSRSRRKSTSEKTKISKRRASNGPSPVRRVAGVFLCFAVSGLMHELVFWALREDRAVSVGLGYEWFLFFTVQAPVVLLEYWVSKRFYWLQKSIPKLLQIFLFLGMQLALANLLFFPPVIRDGLDVRVVADVRRLLGFEAV